MFRPALILFCFVGLSLAGIPWEGEPRPDQWWIDRHESYVQNSVNNRDIPILFYGDSITEGWGGPGRETFDRVYAPLGVANYGIGGDRTEHLIWRMNYGEVSGLSPKLCVLKIGTNNIGANSEQDIAQGIQTVMNTLKFHMPNIKILLLGILPRFNAEQTAMTDRINNYIKGADNGNDIRWFDMRDTFYLGDGQFATELYDPDMLHLSSAGYAKWAEVMNPIFTEMLNS